MEDFYIKCKSEEESKLCEKWAINNSLSSKNMCLEYNKERCYFIVENNEYTLNDAETYSLPEKTLSDLDINTTTGKDWSKVSKEELLEEAKRRYPVGCRVKCLSTKSIELITDDGFFYDYNRIKSRNPTKTRVYYDGKWAEVIPTPEVKETISDSKFIVGKWYKIGNPSNKRINIVKIKKIISNTKIESEIGYKNIFGGDLEWKNTYGTWSNISSFEELSIEEIQQYLPDGHPDKIPNKIEMKSKENPEFKIGDWVTVVNSDNSYSNYRKAIGYTFQIRGDLDGFYFNEFINGKESAIDLINKYGVNYRLKDIRKATQEEIDSVTKPKEITEYAGLKIGDKLPEEIINKWRVYDDNYTSITDTHWFRKLGGFGFISDRFVVSFKEINGFIGFLVSGTNNVYLKADGFKKFMDFYIRPINTQPIKTTSEQYDLSTTITRAVKNNDPSIIARETGKSIDELCDLVDENTHSCLTTGYAADCAGLHCHECQFSQENGKTKESAKAWLRGKSKQSLSDYEAVHVDSQEKWDFVSEKLGYTSRWVSSSKWGCYKKDSCINLEEVGFGTEGIGYSKVISFEDWLDLTGYRSEWDMFPKKPISMRYYMGTDLLIPKECSNPISQPTYPVITDPFAPIVELE